jgi:hypothetical protein
MAAWLPAAALAAVAAVWFFFGWPGSDELVPSDENLPALSARAWEEELFLEGGSFQSFESYQSFEWEQLDEIKLLPEEYLALAGVFLDG